MAIHEVDPISRIEGHLGVKLDTGGGNTVVSADVHGNLWRGFENFLIGRDPNDAITFTQRICGVCPLPHATASMFAVESVLGYNENGVTYATSSGDALGVPAKAVHIRNLVYASEFLMSAITHFYHLAAPSYIQGPNVAPWTPFFADGYYHPYLRNASSVGTGNLTGVTALSGRTTLPANDAGFSKDLWSAVIKQYVKALRIRRLTFEAGALFAGRMPMVSSFVAGGVTNDPKTLAARCTKFDQIMQEVGTFIVKEYVPVVLALGALYPNYDNRTNADTLYSVAGGALWAAAHADNSVPPSNTNTGYGAGVGNFLSWGAFPNPSTQTLAISGGFKLKASSTVTIFNSKKADAAGFTTAVSANLREHIARSRYSAGYGYTAAAGAGSDAYPGAVTRTIPKRDDGTKYSWLKAPRWNGQPMEVGPFARLVVNGLYPVDGTTLGGNTVGGLYPQYLKTNSAAVDGLDPRMINADLAVALVRAGLATATVGAGPATTDVAAIAANYTNAETVITGTINAWVRALAGGLSTMDRLRGRALESLFLITQMIGGFSKTATDIAWTGSGWIDALAALPVDAPTYAHKATPTIAKSGFGVSEAPRGALAHFISIDAGRISAYQCVVPTTWNAGPKDATGNNGPMEQAMIGIPFMANGGATVAGQATQGGVEALRVAQSFDPCIACAVH